MKIAAPWVKQAANTYWNDEGYHFLKFKTSKCVFKWIGISTKYCWNLHDKRVFHDQVSPQSQVRAINLKKQICSKVSRHKTLFWLWHEKRKLIALKMLWQYYEAGRNHSLWWSTLKQSSYWADCLHGTNSYYNSITRDYFYPKKS